MIVFLNAPPPVLERRRADFLAIGLVFSAYTITIWVALKLSFGAALVGGAANTAPVVIFGAAARHFIIRRLAGRGFLTQALGHIALCTAFALLSFWLLIVLLGLANGQSPFEFSVRAFPIQGAAWQLLEEVTTYAVLAALTYSQLGRSASAPQVETPPINRVGATERSSPPESSRYFIRNGEDIRPIDLGRVVCIGGADDYAEVTTQDGKHLVRMTLSEFERTLDPAKFARVHRSWIVNLDCVERVEPAGGGRMLVHMKTGHAIPASRAGARSLRDRVI
jgi:two-component system LytT family response regulator